MWLRESQFKERDSKDPRYSRFDMDFFYMDNYRLSLRFNHETERYEVYKYWSDRRENPLEVCYTYADLGMALRLGNRLAKEIKGFDQDDEPIYDLTRGEKVPARRETL